MKATNVLARSGLAAGALLLGLLAYSQIIPFEIYEFSDVSLTVPAGRLDIVLRGNEREERRGMRTVRIIGSPYDLWVTATLNGPVAEILSVTSLYFRDETGRQLVVPPFASDRSPVRAYENPSTYRLGALISQVDLRGERYSASGTVVLTKGRESTQVPVTFVIVRTFKIEWHVKWWDELMSG